MAGIDIDAHGTVNYLHVMAAKHHYYGGSDEEISLHYSSIHTRCLRTLRDFEVVVSSG